MSDLIKRQDAIDALNECEDIKGHSYTQMHDALMEIPSVDIPHSDDWEKYSDKLWQKAYERGKADRPSGEWIDRSDGGRILNPWWENYECNRCGYYGSGTWNFCPSCGSKMRGEHDD